VGNPERTEGKSTEEESSMKRKISGVEKHIRTWAVRHVDFMQRELAALNQRIQRTTDIRDLQALRKVRTAVVKILREAEQWKEAHL
jgi:hypothetical protein